MVAVMKFANAAVLVATLLSATAIGCVAAVSQGSGMIVEFESEKIEKLENEISHRLGFAVKAHRLQITATCEELKKLGECKKKGG